MKTPLTPSARPEADWQRPLLLLGLLAALSTPVFWFTDLDVRAATLFFSDTPGTPPWPGEFDPLWQFFYYGAPLFAGLLGLGAVAVLLLGAFRSYWRRWRRPAIFVLLTVAVGPGLLINVVFKENWGRPRPRQIEEFHGPKQFVPPLAMGEDKDGKSFAAGHPSIGFCFFTLWFIWRRRNPRLAWLSFGTALGLGALMGLGRMAAGAHFLSDVLWSGFITFFSAWLLYYFVLRIPDVETGHGEPGTQEETTPSATSILLYGGVGALVVLGSLLSFPANHQVEYHLGPRQFQRVEQLHLDLDRATLTLKLGQDDNQGLEVNGQIRGFGLPNHVIDNKGAWGNGDGSHFTYSFRERGIFIELDARLTVSVNTRHLQHLKVDLKEGDILVVADPGQPLPQLQIHTGNGEVRHDIAD